MGFDDSRVRMTTEVESLLLTGLEARGRGFPICRWRTGFDLKTLRPGDRKSDLMWSNGVELEGRRRDKIDAYVLMFTATTYY